MVPAATGSSSHCSGVPAIPDASACRFSLYQACGPRSGSGTSSEGANAVRAVVGDASVIASVPSPEAMPPMALSEVPSSSESSCE
ncbi:hypothetical protein AWH51_09375 [Clavibacter tessellarius]|uniref:Uncharacterized protein n=1 Tax=Clavibacter tessellarius TaxID=31965 RepID=A0A154V1Q5_9MICO|nr:hypothetical protein AWH51_09375 [Clavibacter michiganensis subsp. tessellarius]